MQLCSYTRDTGMWHLFKMVDPKGHRSKCLCGHPIIPCVRGNGHITIKDADKIPEGNEPDLCAECWRKADEIDRTDPVRIYR